jgi:hypothetical protein
MTGRRNDATIRSCPADRPKGQVMEAIGHRVTVPARRTLHQRCNDLENALLSTIAFPGWAR